MGAGGAPATPLNDGALLNVFDHAELVRIKKMKLQDKVHFQRERIIRDAREEVKVNELLKTGSYETRNRDWLFKKNFQLTDHGIIINSSSGCTKDTINTMLDVYFAKTGQKSGELSFNIANGGKISLDFLMKIADTLDERRAATPQKQPTTLDFSAQAIKDMREMGYSSAQIQLLGQRLSNDPSWQPKQSAAPEHK